MIKAAGTRRPKWTEERRARQAAMFAAKRVAGVPIGFAALAPEKRREIASMGGKSVPAAARAYNDRALASAAGRKGGSKSRPTK